MPAVMTIAVNTRSLQTDYPGGYGCFIYETIRRVTQNHPEQQFIFIFDRPFDKRLVFSPNVTAMVTGPPARHPLLWKLWYDVRVPAVLKKYKADVFVSPDGICSLATSVPQCLVVHDLAFLHHPSLIRSSHLRFYKRYTGRFLEKAGSVAAVSAFSKTDILRHYKTEETKISVLYNAAKEIYRPLSFEEKAAVKDKYTEGREYFLYAGAIHPRKNPVDLLKAFSVFKKRQQSGMKLVLAGRPDPRYKSFTESLKTYKYREDVVLTGYAEESELVKIIGAAYALVYPALHDGFAAPVPEAMQCGIPVITSPGLSMQDIAGDAALYANAEGHISIAESMMRLYKDESLRNQLIEKGNEVVKKYSWDRTAELLWQSIMKASLSGLAPL
ncbi:MAG: glycosyltransferase family 4 protein [Bacteroidota bacterium]